MALYPERHSAALPALMAAQRLHGWCSPQALEQVACVMRVTPAYLEAVATFYDMLETPRARAPTSTCAPTSPARCAAPTSCTRAMRDAAGGGDGATVNVRAFECLGACDIAPMASVDGVYVGPLTADDIPQLLDDVRAGRAAAARQAARAPASSPTRTRTRASSRSTRCSVPSRATVRRMSTQSGPMLLLADIDEPGLATIAATRRAGDTDRCARRSQMTPEDVLHELEASGLRGRGGAGFQMGKKVSFLPKGPMDKYLVCNADESEPGTFKDRELMQKNPHALIEGIVIASYAAGANRSFIYIRGEYVQQADVLDAASPKRARPGFIGEDILGSGPRCRWSSTAAPAPTSAARRRRCSTRWKASAATPGSSPRSPPTRASTKGRR